MLRRTTLTSIFAYTTLFRSIDTQTLTVTGTYTIFIDPQKALIGNITLSLFNVVNLTGSNTTSAQPVTTITIPSGKNATPSNKESAGQTISLNITGVTIFASY